MTILSFLKTLWQCFTVWHVNESPNLLKGDCIITHAGGETLDGSPGKINQHLEMVVRQIYKSNRPIPIVAQGELAQCIIDLHLVVHIPKQSESSGYIDTIDVCKIHKKLCEENGWKHPILVSYQPHIWRALKVYQKIGLKGILVSKTKAVYDKNCSQRWMISPWLNTPRELSVRLVWLLQGKI